MKTYNSEYADEVNTKMLQDTLHLPKRSKILLIEDELQSRIETYATLKINDFSIESVSTMKEAIERIKKNEFDLVMYRPKLLSKQE